MSSTTPNIGLTKTTAAETIGQNWAASNDSGGNFDIIDTKMGAVGNTSLQAQVDALSSQLENVPTKIAQSVASNATYELSIEDNHSYLITHMTSSDESTRVILISRRATYVRKFELAAGSWQSYYTETVANNKWTFANGSYVTMINIIDF